MKILLFIAFGMLVLAWLFCMYMAIYYHIKSAKGFKEADRLAKEYFKKYGKSIWEPIEYKKREVI